MRWQKLFGVLSLLVSISVIGATIDQGELSCEDLSEVTNSQSGVSPQAEAFCKQFQAE